VAQIRIGGDSAQQQSRHGASLREHPLRDTLLGEVHARPSHPLTPPAHVSHIALLSDTDEHQTEYDHLVRLCQREGIAPPSAESNHFLATINRLQLRWERHTEFSTFTFVSHESGEYPFAQSAIDKAPTDWLDGVAAELMVAVHISVLRASDVSDVDAMVREQFDSTSLVGSACAGGAASVWTDFRAAPDGFTRILVIDHHLTPNQAGRLIQRLLEVETYRLMALLAFPLARQTTPELGAMESELGDLTDHMADVRDVNDERNLLVELSDLAARIERQIARTNFRFSAASAYAAVLRRRIQFLREQRIEGVQTIWEFMERRLAPAMDTCESVSDRQDRLSKRVSRAANLLRTRVDVALEGQNRDLLDSMNRRVRLQLRLQETVEGLSVVILSYYTVSLVGYGAKALKAAGLSVPVDIVVGLSIVPVVAVMWYGMRRIRRTVTRAEAPPEPPEG
jgi:uncharacterized membrane-anchored protein